MKKCILLIIGVLILSCSDNYNTDIKIVDLIPSNSSLIIKVNAINDFKNALEGNSILSEIDNRYTESISNILNHLNPTEDLFVTIDSSNADYNISYITKNSIGLVILDSTPNNSTKKLAQSQIYKSIINKDTLYHTLIDSLFFGSSSLELVKNSSPNYKNEALTDLLEISDSKKTVTYIYKEQPKTENTLFLNSILSNFTEYSILDFVFESNASKYNGITKSNDTLHLINNFKNTIPQEFKLAEIIPANASSIKRIAFDDYETFATNLSTIKLTPKDSVSSILNYSTEIGFIEFENQNALALYGLDSDLIFETLVSNPSIETYKTVNIFSFEDSNFFNQFLEPFISYSQTDYFFVLENFAVFSNSIESLKSIITNKLNNNTLSNSDSFKSIADDLADESSYLVYKNEEGLNALLDNTSSPFNTNVVQFIYDTNFAHINGVFKAYKKRGVANSITEDFSTILPSELIIAPQTVKNHITKAQDIVVQDVNNILYQISNNGNILWKKQLQGKILGDIQQIDIYKNGRLQLAFATTNRVYVIDRNGKDVDTFPLKFNDQITQPLSVFDYDNKKNYRLLVTQNKNLLMYDVKGKRINGFKYAKATNTISSQPKHFRIGRKDYIVFTQGKTLEVLNRQGKTRVHVNEDISFSGNAVFLYQNKFTTTNASGQLVQVDTKGKINIKPLTTDNNHSVEATSKTLVNLSNNTLHIKSRSIDLDFGEYTNPKIFYLNDKIYISTTDLQAKKVYLFDSQAKPIPNFPVYGTSAATLNNIDKNRGLELITQSDDKTIIVYKLN
ncbi:ribonuclease HII [Winogradskyella immobilis]|uniref:Ribonuclease HII n=1 Tax=Winogradskyella immobilis TaxID=2816852 RepID=A0ABS8EM58_9FLAO|nr:ribonuclease HII [Winogradskyella immobilis]MCC1483937.1 ribonuclease HII [Winogradskyella immobilis]MCG0016030.1 ribonuclease HII [Winogradskyella immobilis]